MIRAGWLAHDQMPTDELRGFVSNVISQELLGGHQSLSALKAGNHMSPPAIGIIESVRASAVFSG
jgi:hypothetical protein